MVDSKENYKFDLGVKGLMQLHSSTSFNWTNFLSWISLQVYIHNEALIQSARHNIVDGFTALIDRFEDPVNTTCQPYWLND